MATPTGRPFWLAPVACVVAVPVVIAAVLAFGHDPVVAEANRPIGAVLLIVALVRSAQGVTKS